MLTNCMAIIQYLNIKNLKNIEILFGNILKNYSIKFNNKISIILIIIFVYNLKHYK